MPPPLLPQTLKYRLTTLSSHQFVQSSHSLRWLRLSSGHSRWCRAHPAGLVHLSCASSSDFKGLGTGNPSNDRFRWPKNREQFNTVLSGPVRQMKHQILALDKMQALQRHFCLFAFSCGWAPLRLQTGLCGACRTTVMLLKASLPYLTS